ncbi:MAG: lysophospholipase [Bacteroidetes bacterium]|nr:MAG: lysophospholipase [Bacteroidota bacterium]
MNRRHFLSRAALTSLGLPALLRAANAHSNHLPLVDGTTILFQGDSITDAGRNRARYYPNEADGMGKGYVMHTVTQLLGQHPDKQLHFYNRGISGNKVHQLAARWDDDCLYLKPDILSILIGVNDHWHTLTQGYNGSSEVYTQDYRALLTRTRQSLPDVRLVIAEPFVVKGGSAIKEEEWFPVFDGYRKAARTLADEFDATFIPLQSIFDQALEVAPVAYWCPDGVHPSMAGAYLMSQAWVEAFAL